MTEIKSNIRFTPVEDPIYTHPLSEPVKYGDNLIEEISIRKPNGLDLLHIGSPVIADPTSGKEAQLNFPVVYKLASAMSGLPEKILYNVNTGDMVDLGWKIGSFFIPGWQDLLPAMKKSKEVSSYSLDTPED